MGEPPQNYPFPQGNVIDTSELLKRLLDNEYIPSELKTEYWALWSQSLKLTFLDDKAINWYHNKFKVIRKRIKNSMPETEFDSKFANQLSMIEIEFISNLHRAKGINGMNERVAEMTQINVHSDNTNTAPKPDNMGIVARAWRAING